MCLRLVKAEILVEGAGVVPSPSPSPSSRLAEEERDSWRSFGSMIEEGLKGDSIEFVFCLLRNCLMLVICWETCSCLKGPSWSLRCGDLSFGCVV